MLPDLICFNSIDNPALTADAVFKGMLQDHGVSAVAILPPDVEHAPLDVHAPSAPHPLVALPAPVAPLPLPPAMAPELFMLSPKNFEFTYHDTNLTISLDGYSHVSGKRRAYCKCPSPDHVDCYKYQHVTNFDAPWKAVAYILVYMRTGYLTKSKGEHQKVEPSESDLEEVFDEMPAFLFSGFPDRL